MSIGYYSEMLRVDDSGRVRWVDGRRMDEEVRVRAEVEALGGKSESINGQFQALK